MTFSKLYISNPQLKERSRKLRTEQTKAEEVLWQELRNKKMGFKFKRQFAIGKFIVDFYCHELKLIIELDGPIHDEQKEYDKKREEWLKNQRHHVVRFKNDEVLFEREKVLEKITSICNKLKK